MLVSDKSPTATAPDRTDRSLTTDGDLELRSDIHVELVDHAASDSGVVRAARVSTIGESAQVEQKGEGYTAGLVNYLMKSRTARPDAAYPSHPQREIEVVAEQMEAAWAQLMPLTHAAFETFGRVSP